MRLHEIKIVQAGRFLKLFKNDALFATPIFRTNNNRKNLLFIIVFKLDDTQYVLNRSKGGYSDKLQRIKTFTPKTLYSGMMAVPFRARETIQVLQVPSDAKDLTPFVTYYSKRQIDSFLFGKIASADVYDPFRDAHSAVFHTEQENAELVPNSDYQGIQDFHPFVQEGDEVLALPCTYQDPIKKMTINLQLLGWYYLEQQLKISWKPANQPRARWRSSLIAIDKKTHRYFFQGNIYKQKGTDPVFLENLSFESVNKSEVKAAFATLTHEIKKQERQALLKLK